MKKKNAIAPKITATGASTIQQQINDTFSSVAADSIAKIVQKSPGTLTGKLDGTNSTLMQALTDTRKNLADYQNALKDFQATVKDSGSLIDETLKTLDSVKCCCLFRFCCPCRFIRSACHQPDSNPEPFHRIFYQPVRWRNTFK